MKAKVKFAFLVILVMACLVGETHAQFYKDMSIGLNGGAYIYQGDLSPDRFGSFKTIKPGFSFFAKKPINHFLAARVLVSISQLKGDESKYDKPEFRQHRNFAFTTPLKEFSGQLVWNILGRNYDDFGLMPYMFTGAGVAFVNIKKDYSRLDTAYFGEVTDLINRLAVDDARGTPRAMLSVPVGLGAEYSISNRLSVNIETSYRFIFTDYLDGFSESVGSKYKDHYHSTSAGLIYKFGNASNKKNLSCPVFRY